MFYLGYDGSQAAEVIADQNADEILNNLLINAIISFYCFSESVKNENFLPERGVRGVLAGTIFRKTASLAK